MLREFSIAVPDAVLADLGERLERTRWADSVAGCGWSMGADVDYLRALIEYWHDEFDWREHEARLNRLPQFIATIDGSAVHFVHVRGSGKRSVPLLLAHGWPGSFAELVKLVPFLTAAGDRRNPELAFDLIIPSIPGFGFSARPARAGYDSFRVADTFVRLMDELGYRRFGLQGGDVGAGIGTAIALKYPDRVLGLHLNCIPGSYRPSFGSAGELTDEERAFLADAARWYDEEGGYAHEQRTRPQTLGAALNDSPAGLAAWLVEKYRGWSDCAGDLERRFTRDEVLVQVMIYWVTATIASSMRYYFENRLRPLCLARGERISVPCGIARFPREAPFPPRTYVERGYEVARWTEMPRGGHFAAHEEPELLAADIRTFFCELLRRCDP